MNIVELKKQLGDIVMEKFKEQYPEIFVRCNTLDPVVHKTCCAGYGWFIDIMNDIAGLSTQTYDIEGITFFKGDFSGAYKMLEDVKNTDNIVVWCFLNLEHR